MISSKELQTVLSYRIGYRYIVPSRHSIENAMKALAKAHMITHTKAHTGRIVTICNYDYYQNPKNYEGAHEGAYEGAPENAAKGTTLYNDDKNVKNENNVNNAKKRDIYTAEVKEWFEYFCEKTNKQYKLNPDRKRIIQKRLKEGYTVEQLKQAVDRFILDDWEERYKNIDVVFCIGTRSGRDNLDKWLNMPEPKAGQSDFDENKEAAHIAEIKKQAAERKL